MEYEAILVHQFDMMIVQQIEHYLFGWFISLKVSEGLTVDENAKIPAVVDAPIEEKVAIPAKKTWSIFVKQYNLPVIEVSLVVSKYIRVLLESLERAASESGEKIPENISQAWEIDTDLSAPTIESFPLDKLLGTLDEDRMDILDTMMRVIINGAERFHFPQRLPYFEIGKCD